MAVTVTINFDPTLGLPAATATSPVTFKVRNNQTWLFNGSVVDVVETAMAGGEVLDINLGKELAGSTNVSINRMDVACSGNSDGSSSWTNASGGTTTMQFKPGSVSGGQINWRPNPTSPVSATIRVKRQ